MKFWLHLCPYSEQSARNESTCIVAEGIDFRAPDYASSRLLKDAKNCIRGMMLSSFGQSSIALEHWILCVCRAA